MPRFYPTLNNRKKRMKLSSFRMPDDTYSHCVLNFMTKIWAIKNRYQSYVNKSPLHFGSENASLMLIFNEQAWNITMYSGLIKPGEVVAILALYQLKLPSLDSKAKLKSPCFFLLLFLYYLQLFFTNLSSFFFFLDEFITKFKTLKINGLFSQKFHSIITDWPTWIASRMWPTLMTIHRQQWKIKRGKHIIDVLFCFFFLFCSVTRV